MPTGSRNWMAVCAIAGSLLLFSTGFQAIAQPSLGIAVRRPFQTQAKTVEATSSIEFLIEDDQGNPIAGAQVSVGNEPRETQCVTGADGRCLLPGRAVPQSGAIPFRITAQGFNTKVVAVGREEMAFPRVLVLTQLKSRASPEAVATSAPQASETPASSLTTSRTPHAAGSQVNWLEQPASEVIIVVLAVVLIAVVVGAAFWTQHAVGRALLHEGESTRRALTRADNRSLVSEIGGLSSAIKAISDHQDVLSKGFESVEQRLNDLSKPRQEPAEQLRWADSQLQASSGLSFGMDRNGGLNQFPQDETGAADFYRAFLRDPGSFAQAKYANAETGSSPLDMLQERPVYLVEVEHRQGSFLLFANDKGNRAWAFPNPDLNFRREVLRPLFPKLDQSTFEQSKKHIQPRELSTAGQKRWKVVPA